MKNVEDNDILFIKLDLFDGGDDCHPEYRIARRGDAVKVRRLSTRNKDSFFVSHVGYLDDCFLVKRDEVMFTDPILTHEDILSYGKNLLESRFISQSEIFTLGEKNVN